jgi:hypothetical protein
VMEKRGPMNGGVCGNRAACQLPPLLTLRRGADGAIFLDWTAGLGLPLTSIWQIDC